MSQNATPTTFVAHVKTGYDDRERHISSMLTSMGIPFEFMLDGDIADITPERHRLYFAPSMSPTSPATSCAMKHLLIYEEMVRRGLPGALVLEDDIVLHSNFREIFDKSLEELAERPADEPVIISYEDTRLRFVERSRRRKGKVTYEGDRDRMTGAYYINLAGAKLMLDEARSNRIDLPIDWMHCKMLRRTDDRRLTYLWCQPCIATQGSHIGLFRSGINVEKEKIQNLKWLLQRQWRKFIYLLR